MLFVNALLLVPDLDTPMTENKIPFLVTSGWVDNHRKSEKKSLVASSFSQKMHANKTHLCCHQVFGFGSR